MEEEVKSGELQRTSKGTFVKGQSGNPLGRPKGSKNQITLAKLALEEQLRDALGPQMAEVAAKVVMQALEGDKSSQKLVWDSIMSKQALTEDKTSGSKQEIKVRTMNVMRGDVIEGEIIDDSTTIEEPQ